MTCCPTLYPHETSLAFTGSVLLWHSQRSHTTVFKIQPTRKSLEKYFFIWAFLGSPFRGCFVKCWVCLFWNWQISSKKLVRLTLNVRQKDVFSVWQVLCTLYVVSQRQTCPKWITSDVLMSIADDKVVYSYFKLIVRFKHHYGVCLLLAHRHTGLEPISNTLLTPTLSLSCNKCPLTDPNWSLTETRPVGVWASKHRFPQHHPLLTHVS